MTHNFSMETAKPKIPHVTIPGMVWYKGNAIYEGNDSVFYHNTFGNRPRLTAFGKYSPPSSAGWQQERQCYG